MLGQSSVPNMHVCMGDDEEVGEGGEGVGRKEVVLFLVNYN